jgi:hypothetical protein
MRYETLSPVLNKKDDAGNPLPNFVTVSNTAYFKDSEDKDLKGKTLEIKFPAQKMSYPVFESLDEFINDAGGSERALEVINDVTQKYATSQGKAVIRNATTGTEDSIVEAGCKASAEFSWKQEQKLTTKDKASLFDQLMAEKDKLTPEALMARIMELSGK